MDVCMYLKPLIRVPKKYVCAHFGTNFNTYYVARAVHVCSSYYNQLSSMRFSSLRTQFTLLLLLCFCYHQFYFFGSGGYQVSTYIHTYELASLHTYCGLSARISFTIIYVSVEFIVHFIYIFINQKRYSITSIHYLFLRVEDVEGLIFRNVWQMIMKLEQFKNFSRL